MVSGAKSISPTNDNARLDGVLKVSQHKVNTSDNLLAESKSPDELTVRNFRDTA